MSKILIAEKKCKIWQYGEINTLACLEKLKFYYYCFFRRKTFFRNGDRKHNDYPQKQCLNQTSEEKLQCIDMDN